MPKPLSLFIRPPFTPWSLEHGYGPELPQPPSGPVMHQHARVATAGAAELFAAANGKLSLRPPGSGFDDPANEIAPEAGNAAPGSVNLYLHLSPLTAGQAAFRQRAATLLGLQGFVYLNVETSSLEDALRELLDKATLSSQPLPRGEVVKLFLEGSVDVPVTAGHAIGKAAAVAGGERQVGFAFLNVFGPFDPAHGYDWLRDFVEDGQAALDAFLQLVPKRWPIIDPALDKAAAIEMTRHGLFPLPALEQLRRDKSLSAAEWRTVGNNQKQLWHKRLLRRAGHADATNTEPPFEFDDLDWPNVFQLEALVEFYANYDDPWKAGAAPRPPTDAAYITVDFLDPAGGAATAAGSVVTLDGAADLTRVRAGADTIALDGDTARPNHLYRITAKDVTARTVTLDAPPALAGASAWRIALRPFLVVVDSFGAREEAKGGRRLRGTGATIQGTTTLPDGSTQTVIKLDGVPLLDRLNPGFDTVYLPGDSSARRAYRIVAADNAAAAKTVTVAGSPSFGGGSSAWQIPAGVSGEPPASGYKLGPGGAKGFDHYDGALFVVYGGIATRRIRWSSYTSRNYDPFDPAAPALPNQSLSSIRGNRRYVYSSFKSGNSFINYALAVVDPAAAGDAEPATYDGVRQARFYFGKQVADDSTTGTPVDGGVGKTAIRLHYGSTVSTSGCGSAGCVVSVDFYSLRDELIRIYQDEYAAQNGAGKQDAQVQKARYKKHTQSVTLNGDDSAQGLDGTNWNNKLTGVLWLIRPDERPEG